MSSKAAYAASELDNAQRQYRDTLKQLFRECHTILCARAAGLAVSMLELSAQTIFLPGYERYRDTFELVTKVAEGIIKDEAMQDRWNSVPTWTPGGDDYGDQLASVLSPMSNFRNLYPETTKITKPDRRRIDQGIVDSILDLSLNMLFDVRDKFGPEFQKRFRQYEKDRGSLLDTPTQISDDEEPARKRLDNKALTSKPLLETAKQRRAELMRAFLDGRRRG